MHFFSTVAAVAIMLAPQLMAAAPTESATVMQVRRHVLERRDCPYESNLACHNDMAGGCVICSLEDPRESLTCLNSCLADAATNCAQLCPGTS